jgi:hypothetical protein
MSIHESDSLQKRSREERPAQATEAPAHVPASNQTIQRAQVDPRKLTPADVTALQRSVGNKAVANLLGRNGPKPASKPGPVIQRALKVGPADDKYEREADEIARSVNVQRSLAPRKRSISSIQRATAIGPEGGDLSGDLENRLRATQGSGSSLPGGVRNTLEPKLGADLSSVKVHTDKNAVQLTQEMGAKAFTHKNHIYYGKGHSPSDMKLTAHETVHTIQQGAVEQVAQRMSGELDEEEEEE